MGFLKYGPKKETKTHGFVNFGLAQVGRHIVDFVNHAGEIFADFTKPLGYLLCGLVAVVVFNFR